jgi:hypothetical protein
MMGIVRPGLAGAALACLLLQAAHAAESCPGNVAAAVAQSAATVPRKKGNEGQVVAAACKLWPYDGKTLLSAIVFSTDDEEVKKLVVAMLDARSGRVVASYEREVGEDASVQFGENSLGIDTAPYQLAKDVRAFGVRFRSAAHGASCADGAWEDELTLFVRTADSLQPVLRGLPMSRWHAVKGCLGQADGLVFDKARLSLGIAPTSSHGLADLTVTARITRESAADDAIGKPKTEQTTLRYDGDAYQSVKSRPWWLSFFPLGE